MTTLKQVFSIKIKKKEVSVLFKLILMNTFNFKYFLDTYLIHIYLSNARQKLL